jgi:hypothetical protein
MQLSGRTKPVDVAPRNDADDENQPTTHFVPSESRDERKGEVNSAADFVSALALLQHLRCDCSLEWRDRL